MSRRKTNLPKGERPITNHGIIRTRYTEDFETRGPLGNHRGQLHALIQKVGIDLELSPGEEPKVVLRQAIFGRYAGGKGTQYKFQRVGLFTNTSKMPGPSFAIPAGPPAFGGSCQAAALGENVQRSREILQQKLDEQKGARVQLRVIRDVAELNGFGEPAQVTSYVNDPSFVCRSCYALSGNYNYPSKQGNDLVHKAWCDYVLSTKGPQGLGDDLAAAIHHVNLVRPQGYQTYFRIHDAGDFYSKEYLEAWVICCSKLKELRFWAPTRQWVFPRWVELLRSAQERVRASGGWLVIRPSALRIGDPVPMVEGLVAGSGVDAHLKDPCVWLCPVYNKVIPDPVLGTREATSCLEAQCTMCWDQPELTVTYAAH